MVTILLVIIAILLFVIAVKMLSPEEVTSLYWFVGIALIFYGLYSYGMYIVAFGYLAVTTSIDVLRVLANKTAIQVLFLGSLAGYWIWQGYLNRKKLISEFKIDFKSGFMKFLIYTAIGCAFLFLMLGAAVLIAINT